MIEVIVEVLYDGKKITEKTKAMNVDHGKSIIQKAYPGCEILAYYAGANDWNHKFKAKQKW